MKANAHQPGQNSRSNAHTISRGGTASFKAVPLFPEPVPVDPGAPVQMAVAPFNNGDNILNHLMGPVSTAITKLPNAQRFVPLSDRYDTLFARFNALPDKKVTSVGDRNDINALITQINTANLNPFVVSAAMQTHIFEGEAAQGNANDLSGFHSAARKPAADVVFTEGARNAAAPYNARVRVRVGGRMLPTGGPGKRSSMFPDGWDEATVVRKIEEAFLAVPAGQDGEVDGTTYHRIGAVTVYPHV